ncbi:hypothetical protein CH360_14760 [Leptospira perolatii]|uniref:DUF1266 domain-containing protein n=1 Tax=Leptospira perolatii TaxID=2023191 RepID=A0ABX4P6H0_9LEPT|nr:hypothetical protein CH360_14760 [Leptospira perolatii]
MVNFMDNVLGKGWFSRIRTKLKEELFLALDENRFGQFSTLPEANLKDYPFYKGGPSSWILPRLEKLAFLETLENHYNLHPDFVFSVESVPLQASEIQRLTEFRNYLIAQIISAIQEDSFDWGASSLIAYARILAIDLSLNSGKLFFLVSYPESSGLISSTAIAEEKPSANQISEEVFGLALETWNFIFQKKIWKEDDYRLLEDVWNRDWELRTGLSRKIAVRNTFDKLIPKLKGDYFPAFPIPPKDQLEKYLSISEEREKIYYDNLKNIYNFRILTRNCTTEIFDSMDRTLSDKEYSGWLGEKVKPRRSFAFIPFLAYESVKDHWKFKSEEVALSYRRKKLQELALREPSWKVYLRESNTLSSTLYKSNEEDPPFLFFTDDIILVRPIYGLINISYAIGNGALGVLTLPFDKGKRLQNGLQSMFFSLPELFFFNIRKGSFPAALDSTNSEIKSVERKDGSSESNHSPSSHRP